MGEGLRRARTAARVTRKPLPSVKQLAEEAFDAAEYHQGKGFISDALGALPTQSKLFEVVRGHLWHHEEAGRRIKAFLRKYGEMYPSKHR